MLIATIDYECRNHCNELDDIYHIEKNNMLSELEVICQDKEIEGCLVIFAKNISPSCKPLGSLYSNYMLLSVHHSGGVERETIQDNPVFLLTELGLCYPIKDYWLHCFTASTFAHFTSTPLC